MKFLLLLMSLLFSLQLMCQSDSLRMEIQQNRVFKIKLDSISEYLLSKGFDEQIQYMEFSFSGARANIIWKDGEKLQGYYLTTQSSNVKIKKIKKIKSLRSFVDTLFKNECDMFNTINSSETKWLSHDYIIGLKRRIKMDVKEYYFPYSKFLTSNNFPCLYSLMRLGM